MRWTLALLGLPAFLACSAPAEDAEERDSTTSRIVGGDLAAPNTFPGVVRMQSSSGTLCGATLIGKEWALTAAHCVDGLKAAGETVTLTAGKTRLSGPGGEVLRVVDIIVHEGYDGESAVIDNDVALLKLSAPTNQAPARLVTLAEWQKIGVVGTPITILGWGRTTANGQQSNDLRQVTLPFISRQQCASTPNTICVADPNEQKGQCPGDSGGPWFAMSNGAPVYVGTVSWTQGNCNLNQGAMRVVNYLSWISTNTGGQVPEVTTPTPPPPPEDTQLDGGVPGATEPAPTPPTQDPPAADTDIKDGPAPDTTERRGKPEADAKAPEGEAQASSCSASPGAGSSLSSGFGLSLVVAALVAARRRRR